MQCLQASPSSQFRLVYPVFSLCFSAQALSLFILSFFSQFLRLLTTFVGSAGSACRPTFLQFLVENLIRSPPYSNIFNFYAGSTQYYNTRQCIGRKESVQSRTISSNPLQSASQQLLVSPQFSSVAYCQTTVILVHHCVAEISSYFCGFITSLRFVHFVSVKQFSWSELSP